MFDLRNDAHLRLIATEVYGDEQNRYRREIDAQWRVLRGDLEYFVKESIKSRHTKTYGDFEVSQLNVAKQVTEKRSRAYAESPIRILDTPEESELYNEKMRDSKSIWEWRKFDVYYNYFFYTAMWYQFYDDESGDQKLGMRALRPNQFARIVNDRGETEVFIVHLGNGGIDATNIIRGDLIDTNIQDEPEDNQVKNLAVWTKDQHAIIQVTGSNETMKIIRKPIEGNEEGVNELGKIPATFAQVGDARERPAFNSLAEQTIDLNYIMSYIITGTAMQTFGNLVVTRPEGMALPDEFGQSLFTYFDVPQQEGSDVTTSIDYINPTSNISSALEVFNTNLMRILDENNVKASESTQGGQNFTSGYDRLLSRMDTTEVIEFNQEVYVDNEKEGYEICKAYSEAVGKDVFKSDSLQVIFKKPRPMKTKMELISEIKALKEEGLIEEWEKYKILDPNMTEDQAKEKLERVKAERVNTIRGDLGANNKDED